jgi:hypothetical protein
MSKGEQLFSTALTGRFPYVMGDVSAGTACCAPTGARRSRSLRRTQGTFGFAQCEQVG